MADDSIFDSFPGGGWGAATAGAGGLGLISDLYAFVQNQKARDQAQRLAREQKGQADVLNDPAQVASYINRLYQPMTAVQNQAVQRDLGSNWAVMTGGAPGGAMNQYVADALAKLESSRYSDATTAALRALGGAQTSLSGAAATTPSATLPMGATGDLLKQLLLLKALRDGNQKTPGITVPLTQQGDAGSSSEVVRDRTTPADTMSDVAYPDLAGATA